jgi:hypothetical protein
VAGIWGGLPQAPIATNGQPLSVWTGSKMLVFARGPLTPPWSTNVAAAYNTATSSWRRLAPPPGEKGNFEGSYSAAWTGKEMLVWGPFTLLGFNPVTNHWRTLPPSPLAGRGGAGIVVWSGREMIGWGGGCCGDAFSDGAAYNPAANTWRKLAAAPIGGQQRPVGAWTGSELVVFGGRDADGKRVGGAAYSPATDSWHRIAPQPALRGGANAVWDGGEVLVVGGTGAPRGGRAPKLAPVGLAYNPATNRWRRLPPMESGRLGAAVVWTGRRLLVWGGQSALTGEAVFPAHGLAYDPKANRWSPLPPAPVLGRVNPAVVWTGRSMFVWGGATSVGISVADGAVFRPATP